jgi:hypothetical protein
MVKPVRAMLFYERSPGDSLRTPPIEVQQCPLPNEHGAARFLKSPRLLQSSEREQPWIQKLQLAREKLFDQLAPVQGMI